MGCYGTRAVQKTVHLLPGRYKNIIFISTVIAVITAEFRTIAKVRLYEAISPGC